MTTHHYAVVTDCNVVPVVTEGYSTRHAAARMAALLTRCRGTDHWTVAYDTTDGPPENPDDLPTSTVGAPKDRETKRLEELERQREETGRAERRRLGLAHAWRGRRR